MDARDIGFTSRPVQRDWYGGLQSDSAVTYTCLNPAHYRSLLTSIPYTCMACPVILISVIVRAYPQDALKENNNFLMHLRFHLSKNCLYATPAYDARRVMRTQLETTSPIRRTHIARP